jgi:mannose-6-phosphate isomerase-like protein (cupin superfamily)
MTSKRSATADEALRQYEVGDKLRQLRLRKKMGLVELGQHTGLSPGLLSKIERSLVWPPLPTLLRIAMVFGVGLEYFFTDESRRHVVAVVRSEERERLPMNVGKKTVARFESLDYPANERRTNAWLAEFETVSASEAEPHAHDGSEFIYVISGTLVVTIGSREVKLRRDDSIYFDSTVPHWYSKSGSAACRAIVVTAG